jgi:outer membrane translocation and assembly module TamA
MAKVLVNVAIRSGDPADLFEAVRKIEHSAELKGLDRARAWVNLDKESEALVETDWHSVEDARSAAGRLPEALTQAVPEKTTLETELKPRLYRGS